MTTDKSSVVATRPSSLTGYLTCPRGTWVRDNVDKLDKSKLNPPTISINARVGTCVHEHIAFANSDYEHRVEEWFNNNVTQNSDEQLVMTRNLATLDDAVRAANKVLEAFRDHGLMNVFAESKHLHEESMEDVYDIRGGKKLILKGTVDLYSPNQETVIDIKTSGSNSPGYYGAQLAAYATLLESTKGVKAKRGRVYFARQNKELTPQIVEHHYDLDVQKRHFRQVIDIVALATDQMEGTGDPTRISANPGCWKCSEKWCRAYNTEYCPETLTTQINKEI